MSRYIKADLLNSVVGAYDQTKTTIQGRASSRTIDGVPVLGPRRNKFIDIFTDFGITPGQFSISTNGRIIVAASAPTNGPGSYDTLPICLYDFNLTLGVHVAVGRIDILLPNLAATTHVVRDIRITNDSTNTGWKIFVTTTASTLINGGVFCVNSINKSDFQIVGWPTIAMATSSNAKSVYFLQDPAAIGAGQLNIASAGGFIDSVNSRLCIHNGVAATHQYYFYDIVTNPTYVSSAVSVSVGTPGVVTHNTHPFSTNDPVVFTTGTLPTGLTVGTIYFVRNPTANTYELSATSGGASINTTGSPSAGAEIGRAWGTTGSNFVHKTGNLPALSGTLLSNSSEDYGTPSHTTNSGFPSVFLATSTTLYCGRISELTPGATTWPSLVSSNMLGSTNEIITPTATSVAYAQSLDRSIIAISGSRFLMKQIVNNSLDRRFGTQNISFLEGVTVDPVDFGCQTSTAMDLEDGWLGVNSTAVGQRGLFLMDARSESLFDYSFIVTKVIDITTASELKAITFLRQYNSQSSAAKVQYRTSGFGSISGGWTDIDALKYVSISAAAQIQFKISFNMMSRNSTIGQQIAELILNVESLSEISDNWEFSDDFSDNNTPSRTAFRLKKVYATSVPQLFFRAYDLSNSLLTNHNTVDNASNFQYSTDNGTTWLPLGTIPNTVGTLVRYTFTSPPGVDIRPGLKES